MTLPQNVKRQVIVKMDRSVREVHDLDSFNKAMTELNQLQEKAAPAQAHEAALASQGAVHARTIYIGLYAIGSLLFLAGLLLQ